MTLKKVTCNRCGGYGGEDASLFGDVGWHPCFHCGTEGVCSCDECLKAEEAFREYQTSHQEDREAEQSYQEFIKNLPVCDDDVPW